MCKPNVRGTLEIFEKYFKTICFVFKDERIENEMQSLSLLVLFRCTTVFFYVRRGPVFDGAFHHVTQRFWYGKTYYENIVLCVCL